MTELEKKLLLTEEAYAYLMEHLSYERLLIQKPIITQINYYFDTDDFSMDRQNITCRVRLKDGKYQATMKKHASGADQSTETDLESCDGLENNAFTDMGLKLQGELLTKRCVIAKEAHCEAVLDKNEYLGYTDYELEIEYLPKHEKEARSLQAAILDSLPCSARFISYKENSGPRPKVPSKSNRFFERRKKNDRYTSRNLCAEERKDPDH